MTITTGRRLGGHRRHAPALRASAIFTIDAPSIGPERHAPLLVLHGFPTSSFDYAAVLDGLRAGRRVLLFDMLGYGLSAKPDRAYPMALQADIAAAFVAALGIGRLALLTHDMGDTVGGELLARRAEGRWPVEVTRRVVTNGSIYIEQAHLTDGQQLLLGLPDERAARAGPDRRRLPRRRACATRSAPTTPQSPTGGPRTRCRRPRAQIVHDDGQRLLPRLIRYIEERRRQRAPLHRGHRDRPLTAAHRLGARRPHRRPLHGRHAAGGPPRRHRRPPRPGWATTRWSRRRTASWAQRWPGSSRGTAARRSWLNLAPWRAVVDPRTATSSSPARGRATSWPGPTHARSRPTTRCSSAQEGAVRWYRCLRCDDWVQRLRSGATGPRAGRERDEIRLPVRGAALRDRYVLRLIALDRAIHVVVLTSLAIVLFTFAAHDQVLHRDYQNIMDALAGGAPGASQARGVLGYLGRAFKYSPSHLRILGGVLLAYAALEATEMVGLWLNKRWAEYLTFIATTILVPYEVYELRSA